MDLRDWQGVAWEVSEIVGDPGVEVGDGVGFATRADDVSTVLTIGCPAAHRPDTHGGHWTGVVCTKGSNRSKTTGRTRKVGPSATPDFEIVSSTNARGQEQLVCTLSGTFFDAPPSWTAVEGSGGGGG